jgi:serine/threonine-protein kinase
MPIVGDVLADRYRLESVLGVGGMASVYLATDLRLDREVAVKVLAANLAADAAFAERFNGEAGAMAGFSHPNVAAVYDVEPGDPTTGREPFYVMEYCEGGSLADRLKAHGPMRPADLVPIVTAISEGLAELHGRGIVHRDVKPANILFAGDRPKLADFGVARSEEARADGPLTVPGSTLGTLPYLAPELVAGAPASAASDVYALGVTIFQSLTGRYPEGSLPGTPMRISTAAPDLGPAFDAALAGALDADPLARPSPTELTSQLAAGLQMSGVARPNPGALAGMSPAPAGAAHVDVEAPTTVVATARPAQPPAQNVARAAPEPEPRERGRTTARGIGWGVLAGFVAALVILAIVVLPRLQGGGVLPGASATATASGRRAGHTASDRRRDLARGA